MNKLDKLYFAALRTATKHHRRSSPGIRIDPESRPGIMQRAKMMAKSRLKDERAAARAAKGCPRRFLDSYLGTALWSSTDESTPSGGDPLDRNYSISDFTQASLRKAKKDCDSFYEYARAELDAAGGGDEQNGHDFWLTRNRHGAGFWDRGYGKIGDQLTKKAQSFGEVHIFVQRGRLHYEG